MNKIEYAISKQRVIDNSNPLSYGAFLIGIMNQGRIIVDLHGRLKIGGKDAKH